MHERMEELSLSFPSLREASGTKPWAPLKLDEWASHAQAPHRARCAAQFVLMVWNPAVPWDSGKLDIIEALMCWGEGDRCAFLQWAAAPWWP